ncbi:Glycosyl hydrolase family 76 domain containing protein [Naviculisporaceae sp. PSN 640]
MVISKLSALLCGTFISLAAAQQQVDTPEAIAKSAETVAKDLVDLYDVDKKPEAPGRLENYNYWQGGALMSTLIDYWHKTNDSAHNKIVTESIGFQFSEDTFMPANLRPSYLGNSDQCFWGLAAITAAEDELPGPQGVETKWVEMAQAVYDMQKARLDEETKWCNGGLRWGIDASHHGWGSKDASGNGCLFNLAARLARYTGDKKYAQTATTLYDWMAAHLIKEDFRVLQGSLTKDDCKTGLNKLYHSIDGTIVTQGAAFMYNYTSGSSEWRTRVEKHTASVLKDFFPSNYAFEPGCEVQQLCNSDELAFKGVNFRSLAVVTQLAPFTAEKILPALETSAKAIALGCKNPPTSRRCQFYWLELDPDLIIPDEDPATSGVGEAMNALSAFSSLFIETAAPPAVAPPPPPSSPEDSGEVGNGGGDGDSGTGPGEAQDNASGGGDKKDDKSAGPRMFDMPGFVTLGLGLLFSSWLGSNI